MAFSQASHGSLLLRKENQGETDRLAFELVRFAKLSVLFKLVLICSDLSRCCYFYVQ